MQDDKRKINKFILRNATELFDVISLELNARDKMIYYLSTMFDSNPKWSTIHIGFNKEFLIEFHNNKNKHEFIVGNSELEYYIDEVLQENDKINDLLNSDELKYMIFFNKLYKYLHGIELFNISVVNLYELNKLVGHVENFIGEVKTAKMNRIEMELGKYTEIYIHWKKKEIIIGRSITGNYIGIDGVICNANDIEFSGSNFVIAKKILKSVFDIDISTKEFKVE